MSGNVLLLIAPLAAIALGKLAEIILQRFFIGEWLHVIRRAVYILGWWIAAFFFFYLLPEAPPVIGLASYGILVLAIASTATRCTALIKNRMVLYSILRAGIYLAQGITIRSMIFTLWPNGVWDLGFQVSVADMALGGYLVLSACSLLRMLELSEFPHRRGIGKWFGEAKVTKFLFACFMIFLFKDMWQYIGKIYKGNLQLAQWIFIFFILLMAALIINIKIKRSVEVSFSANLQRHKQNVDYIKGNELPEVSALVKDFIDTGEMSGILTYLIVMANGLGIPRATTSKIMSSMIEYRDIQNPGFGLRRELQVIQQKNRESRSAVLNKTIERIRYYGRKTNEE